MAERHITDVAELTQFDSPNYQFDEANSTDTNLVFCVNQQWISKLGVCNKNRLGSKIQKNGPNILGLDDWIIFYTTYLGDSAESYLRQKGTVTKLTFC